MPLLAVCTPRMLATKCRARDVLGYLSRRRPRPYLISAPDIRKLLTAALAMRPAGTIAPLTWHHLFGLIAVTGLRISEALALTLNDITPDGLVIRNTKFRKSRMVALHPSTRDALNRYLTVRRKEKTLDGHLFVITTGGPPSVDRAEQVLPRARGTNGNPKTRRGTRTDPALAAALLRCPVTREPRSRRRSEPSHAGARHLPRPRQCLACLLVPGINPSPPARYRRGRRAGSHEWRFR